MRWQGWNLRAITDVGVTLAVRWVELEADAVPIAVEGTVDLLQRMEANWMDAADSSEDTPPRAL